MPDSLKPVLLFAGGYTSTLYTLAFDPAARTLTKLHSTAAAGEAPTWLVLSPSGKHLYAVDEWAGASAGAFGQAPETARKGVPGVHSFAVQSDGRLEKLNSVPSYGDSGCHAALTRGERPHLLVANYLGRTAASIAVLPDGRLDADEGRHQVVDFAGHGKTGSHPTRQDKDHPHAVEIDPSGRWVVVPDLGTDELKLLSVADGKLDLVAVERLGDAHGPRHVLWSTTSTGETLLYILNELGNSVSLYSFTPSTDPSSPPTLRPLQTHLSLLPPSPHPHQPSFATWHAAELALSPAHKLYLTNRADNHDPLNGSATGPADLVAVFDVDPATGRIVEDSRVLRSAGGRGARHLALSSESLVGVEGDWVAVALHDSDEIVIFEREGWEEVARLQGVGRPACVVWA